MENQEKDVLLEEEQQHDKIEQLDINNKVKSVH